jgi:hypothetical protein
VNEVKLHLPKLFLTGYKDFPREIQDKSRNLLHICILGIILFVFMLFRVIRFSFDPFEALASTYAIIALGLTLLFLSLKKPVLAGDTAICTIFYVFINFVLRDAFSEEIIQISRINDTTVALILGLLLTTSFVIRKSQYIFAILSSYFIIVSHFFTLVLRYYSGVFPSDAVILFLETLLLLTAFLYFGLSLLSLPEQGRGQVFSNIIFYKLGAKGPFVAYSEHQLPNNVEYSSGAYFYSTIGQGDKYATGLFGPIPFGVNEEKMVALIYATRILDSSLIDSRLKCQNYLLIALISVQEKLNNIDREDLEEQLDKITKDISDLCNLTAESFASLVNRFHFNEGGNKPRTKFSPANKK